MVLKDAIAHTCVLCRSHESAVDRVLKIKGVLPGLSTCFEQQHVGVTCCIVFRNCLPSTSSSEVLSIWRSVCGVALHFLTGS